MRFFGSLGSSLGNAKSKLFADKFLYSLTVHNLSPWPQGQRSIAIGWQRGKKKRGATRSVYPSTAPGRAGAVVRFNEKFEVSASLYKAATGSSAPAALGPFKKKCIILAVLETDGRTQATAALGRVVIDLAEFAAIEHQETRSFQVTCHKGVHSAVGDPQLTITIRCRWKDSSKTASANGMDPAMDDIGSNSTDTTGSRMTTNLSSFLRLKYSNSKKGSPANEDQDLGGFDGASGLSTGAAGISSRQDLMEMRGMGTIQEGAEECPPHTRAGEQGKRLPPNIIGSEGRNIYGRLKETEDLTGSTVVPKELSPVFNKAEAMTGGAAVTTAAVGGISLREMHSGTAGNTRSLRPNDEDGTAPSNRVTPRESETPSRVGSIRSVMSDLGPSPTEGGNSAYTELLMAAATEVCVHLGRVSAARRPERNLHAPARRAARTMVCLGEVQGTAFGRQVVSIVEAQVAATPSSDLPGLAFWWDNVVHLKAVLQTLGSGAFAATSGSVPSARWAADALVPELARLERSVLFNRVLQSLWDTLLAEAARAAAAASGKATPGTKRALQEAAIKVWFTALDALSQRLASLGPHGHSLLLRQQVLQQCLRRLDALFFHHLVLSPGAEPSDLLVDYNPNEDMWGPPGSPIPSLDEACLPFTRGAITFGSGMGVKMAVTRLQQWASGEGLNEMGPMGAATPQLPLLRATADLLMMPKELLAEPAIRRDISQALSIRSMLHILEGFQPDEYARDPIDPAVIAVLKDEQAVAPSTRPPLSDLAYRPQVDDATVLKACNSSGTQPGIEYDAESEGELEELGALVGGGSSGTPPSRMRMLHQLWALGVPRRRGP